MLPEADAEHEDRYFRLAMGSAGIAMGVVADGRWQQVNQALAGMLSSRAEDLRGQAVIDAFAPEDRERTSSFLSALQQAPASHQPLETRLRHANGNLVEVLLDAVREAGPQGSVLLQLRDVSELRRLAKAHEEAEEANARLQAFVYGVSHDLRAPLRAIDGFAGKLARQLQEGTVDASGHDALARIRNATARMGSLIDSLLELARIGRAPLRPVQVDVSLLADWCAAELQDAAPQRAASIDVQQGLQVVGDERLLKTMLKQLLDNAWRFSASREAVAVSVTGERTASGLRLWIRDKGIGFDMAYASKLFEPFQRLHGIDEGAGNGLGLTIAEQVAARHGGSIRAQASVDEGACFEIHLHDLQPRELQPMETA